MSKISANKPETQRI